MEKNIFMMKQKMVNWQIWLENSKELENSFNFYLDKEMIKLEKESS